ncbi:C4-dicarboxylate-binding protein DctP [Salsuginibacillus halophilus]|uniref:C4-dicarboxylate-binding protein DctP n=1 Tax=Salsuginibacillus halophilus TaxID=517424 RepID=A0A2P8HLE4_9BACI|nr:DctP family TRAP transporter solute-binding subunit [Salsuginibacillus halophilus]PSL47011.1 C4-dicarboxylate-binding protein DctP [Salsuginibacillus halophilus]
MKNLIAIVSFVCLGIIASIYVGFGQLTPAAVDSNDRELDGLNEKYVLDFTHIVAENTPKGRAAVRFAQKVEEKTDGWVEVNVHPNGLRYEAQEEFDALQNNQVDFIAPAFSEIAVRDESWMIMDLPYAFTDYDEVSKAYEGKIGEKLFESIEARGYKPLDFWDNGFKQLTNDVHPIEDPQDMSNLSFRVMPSEVLNDTMNQLGAAPENAPFNEVYSMLNEGIVDGTENTLSNIYSKGFYTEQKYLTKSNHNYLGYAVLMNPTTWRTLPSDYQSSIQEAMDETTEWLEGYAQTMNEEMSTRVTNASIKVTRLTDSDIEKWRQELQPVYNRYRNEIGHELMFELEKMHEDELGY